METEKNTISLECSLLHRLPPGFLLRMRELLKEEYEAFYESYRSSKIQGLRLNRLKGTKEEFFEKNPFTLSSVPWAEDGFYYPNTERPGKHPYHEAGLYYIQEPSAMAVAQLLAPDQGEKVLDLCAAPGGKTTHLASLMQGEGLLVSNEIHPARAKVLSRNVERMGAGHIVVTNEEPKNLAKRFIGFFDKIVVDAPCSGEGMFRKEEAACAEWSIDNVSICAVRQLKILEHAAEMLKGGGRLVYSTCTFAPEENEGTVSAFLRNHPEFEIDASIDYDWYYKKGFAPGRPDWVSDGDEAVTKTFRLFPHRIEGEGHYIAVLHKKGREPEKESSKVKEICDKKQLELWNSFQEELGISFSHGRYVLFGEQLYLVPDLMIDMTGLKIVRAGLHLGTMEKKRFEPSHALALALKPENVQNVIELSAEGREIISYLKGETLTISAKKGWCLITVDKCSIGWGKSNQGMIKNHYPKGLRWM